jgi:putative Mg2+ transporter-C (MgtC) family protein
MRTGANVRGLTTAASIWSSSAIGILVGIHFVLAAFGVAVLFLASMVVMPWFERHLPGHTAMVVTLRYREGARPQEDQVLGFLKDRGLSVQSDTVSVIFDGVHYVLEFVVSASGPKRDHSLGRAVADLPEVPSIDSFTIARTSRG